MATAPASAAGSATAATPSASAATDSATLSGIATASGTATPSVGTTPGATATGTASAAPTAGIAATASTAATASIPSTPATSTTRAGATASAAATTSATAPATGTISTTGAPAGTSGPRLVPGFTAARALHDLQAPVGVAVDARGSVFIAEEDGTGTILRLARDHTASVVASGLPLPVGGIAIDHGAIDVAAGDAIYRINPEATTGTTRKSLAVGLHGPLTGLALGPDGRLYVGLLDAGHLGAMPDRGGTLTTLMTGLFGPAGVAAGPRGDIYVVNNGQKGPAIERVAIAAGLSKIPTLVVTLPPNAQPLGIAFEPKGPFGSGGIAYVSVDGGIDAVNVTTGMVTSFLRGLVRPAGLAFTRDGRTLYVIDTGETIAGLPVRDAGSLWRVTSSVVNSSTAAATPAMQTSPQPGPHNKVRPVPGPLPWYRDVRTLYVAVAGLLLLGALLLMQFRRAPRRH